MISDIYSTDYTWLHPMPALITLFAIGALICYGLMAITRIANRMSDEASR